MILFVNKVKIKFEWNGMIAQKKKMTIKKEKKERNWP